MVGPAVLPGMEQQGGAATKRVHGRQIGALELVAGNTTQRQVIFVARATMLFSDDMVHLMDGERVGFGQAAILATTAGSRAHSLAQFGRQAGLTHEAAPPALSLKAALALATRIRCSTRMISSHSAVSSGVRPASFFLANRNWIRSARAGEGCKARTCSGEGNSARVSATSAKWLISCRIRLWRRCKPAVTTSAHSVSLAGKLAAHSSGNSNVTFIGVKLRVFTMPANPKTEGCSVNNSGSSSRLVLRRKRPNRVRRWASGSKPPWASRAWFIDRKSTRLNSSHLGISYAVFFLDKTQ